MSNELKNDELLKGAVENITEAELKEIAAAGDINPETTSKLVSAVVTTLLGCKKK